MRPAHASSLVPGRVLINLSSHSLPVVSEYVTTKSTSDGFRQFTDPGRPGPRLEAQDESPSSTHREKQRILDITSTRALHRRRQGSAGSGLAEGHCRARTGDQWGLHRPVSIDSPSHQHRRARASRLKRTRSARIENNKARRGWMRASPRSPPPLGSQPQSFSSLPIERCGPGWP